MERKETGFGFKTRTFARESNSLYSVGKTNKLKEQIIIGTKNNVAYYTNPLVVLKTYKINDNLYVRDNGILEIK